MGFYLQLQRRSSSTMMPTVSVSPLPAFILREVYAVLRVVLQQHHGCIAARQRKRCPGVHLPHYAK